MSTADSAAANESERSGRLQELREKAARSIQQREQSLLALEACEQQLAAAQRESNQLRAAADRLQQAIASLEQEVQQANAKKAEDAKELERLGGLVRQADSWRERAQRRMSNIEAENQGLSTCVQDLATKLDQLRSRNAELLRNGDAARRNLEELRASARGMEALRSSAVARERQVAQLKQALESARTAQCEAQEARCSIEERSNALEAASAEHVEQVRALTSTIAERNARVEALEQEADKGSERVALLDAQLAEARAALVAAKQELQEADSSRATRI